MIYISEAVGVQSKQGHLQPNFSIEHSRKYHNIL